ELTRATAGDATGFVTERRFKQGASGTLYCAAAWTWDPSTVTKALTNVTIRRPLVATERRYHTASTVSSSGYNETSYSYTAHTSTFALAEATTTHPSVSSGNNGSGNSVVEYTHFKKDGLVDYRRVPIDPDASTPTWTIEYTEYTDGQVTKHIDDADTSSSDITGTVPTDFGKDSSSETKEHKKSTSTYVASGFKNGSTKAGDSTIETEKEY